VLGEPIVLQEVVVQQLGNTDKKVLGFDGLPNRCCDIGDLGGPSLVIRRQLLLHCSLCASGFDLFCKVVESAAQCWQDAEIECPQPFGNPTGCLIRVIQGGKGSKQRVAVQDVDSAVSSGLSFDVGGSPRLSALDANLRKCGPQREASTDGSGREQRDVVNVYED